MFFFAIFGFSYKWDWGLDYKTYSNVIIVGFTRLIVSMGNVTNATTVIHLVSFYSHPFALQFTFAISNFFVVYFVMLESRRKLTNLFETKLCIFILIVSILQLNLTRGYLPSWNKNIICIVIKLPIMACANIANSFMLS